MTLDVLLAEGNVARAAQRLKLSPSAMSRSLARLRTTTGDPLLVRAGRGLVPTPRALQLREQVSQLVQDASAVLRPAEKLNLKQLQRTFTLRASDGFAENFGPDLVALTATQAPGVRIRFAPKLDKSSAASRRGRRPGHGRDWRRHRAGSANARAFSGPIHRCGALRARPQSTEHHGVTLCGGPARPRFAARVGPRPC